MRIAFASGKGGTGKTTLAVNVAVALSSEETCYVDCDVEEPNGHLYLAPAIEEEETVTVPVPREVPGRCTGCGRCQETCQFRAILALKSCVMVFDSLCHACGTCLIACPEEALIEAPRPIGVMRRGRAGRVRFLEGRLNVGEARSTPLIAAVRKHEPVSGLVLADAPPGATCPTMEAIKESDLVVLVTEPTPFGLHDLRVVVELSGALGLPVAAVVNRADLGDREVMRFCETEGVPVLAEIPYDEELAAAGAEGWVAAARSARARERFTRIADAALELAASSGRRGGARERERGLSR